ncbi:TPA: hypothetical protein ACNBZL_004980 [Escherichia coli]|nr:hypothetical protein [Escherichia coli]MCZ5062005.1 hypothetical protein [Escherichia coli]MCZ5089135.1 hypothetical protein [Escherichia coli]MCZ5175263.1 hypothetical protein [Escherichia coli]MCZ5209651.1 hypothetical protein [Escherichia coli]MCZ5670018.1 hypothetical protein [Escherichia coli]
MTTFTKEQLLSHARESVSYLENVKGRVSKEGADCKVVLEMVERDLELARIALTSLEAEPVAVNDDMAYAFHHALSDSSPGADEVEEIKAGLRAAFANVTTQPAPVVPEFETWFNSQESGRSICSTQIRRSLQEISWNACCAAMLQGKGDGILTNEDTKGGVQVRELTMLIKQLVSQLRKAKPDCKLPEKAMVYLKRNGLINAEDILR